MNLFCIGFIILLRHHTKWVVRKQESITWIWHTCCAHTAGKLWCGLSPKNLGSQQRGCPFSNIIEVDVLSVFVFWPSKSKGSDVLTQVKGWFWFFFSSHVACHCLQRHKHLAGAEVKIIAVLSRLSFTISSMGYFCLLLVQTFPPHSIKWLLWWDYIR